MRFYPFLLLLVESFQEATSQVPGWIEEKEGIGKTHNARIKLFFYYVSLWVRCFYYGFLYNSSNS